eukprot:4560826-Prymnesium_polylepis.1
MRASRRILKELASAACASADAARPRNASLAPGADCTETLLVANTAGRGSPLSARPDTVSPVRGQARQPRDGGRGAGGCGGGRRKPVR